MPASGRSAVQRAVLQHGDMLAERHHLVEAVRDVEDGVPSRRAGARSRSVSVAVSWADSEEVGSSRMRTRGSAVERLGDLDHLPAAERQLADRQSTAARRGRRGRRRPWRRAASSR